MLQNFENQNVARIYVTNCWKGGKICLEKHIIEQKSCSLSPQL